MKNIFQSKAILIAVAFGTLLAGCSSEPSEKDIQAAITKDQQATPDMVKGIIPEVTSAKKVGCKADGEKAYLCDLEMEIKQMGMTNKVVAPIRFVKVSDGWAMTK